MILPIIFTAIMAIINGIFAVKNRTTQMGLVHAFMCGGCSACVYWMILR